jgi:hypothetical protein
VILKTKFLGDFLLRSALDDHSSQGFVSPMIDVCGLREIPPHRRVVHDLASRKMSVGDHNNRPSDFTQAVLFPADESHEFSPKTRVKCELSISLPKTQSDLKWSKSMAAD